MNCIFCHIYENEKDKIIYENDLFFVIYDKYPLNEGHALVIPKRHFADFYDMTEAEWQSSRDVILKTKEYMEKKYAPSAYNIGVNVGSDAGQSVFHAHIHIIPRYSGDIENPGPQQKKVNMPLFEFMRDNDLFKKIIYSQLVNRKLEQVIEKSHKNSLEEIKGDKVYLEQLKKELKQAVDDLCDENDCQAYDRIIEVIELISIVNG